MTEYVTVHVAVAVNPDGSWRAIGASAETLRDSMGDAVRVSAYDDAGPAHVHILRARLPIPSRKIIKPKVSEP